MFIKHREEILNMAEIGASSGQLCSMLNAMYAELEAVFNHKHKQQIEAIADIHRETVFELRNEMDKYKQKYILETLSDNSKVNLSFNPL